MELWHSIVLGLVEGITEFLPISSTGHLILASELLRIPDSDFLKSFEIIIQLGAIGAVIALYWKSFTDLEVLKKLLVAFVPTGAVGLLLYPFIKTYLLGNSVVVLWALLFGGIALIAFEHLHRETPDATDSIGRVSYRQALLIGCFQAIAVVPGVSRAAATILGGLWVGLKRTTIVEFSFLLAVPTMLAASGLDLVKSYATFSSEQFGTLLIGFVVSLLTALVAIKFLVRYIQTHTFIPFGIYRIIIAVLFFLILW